MYGFSGRFGDTDDPWFRIGTVGITTTVGIAALGFISMFVWAIEGNGGQVFSSLVLDGRVLDGQLWRLVTWPIPNEPDIWTVVLFVVFYMLGSQLEAVMGRRLFTIYALALTVLPALAVSVLEVAGGPSGRVWGLRILELGILIAFAAHFTRAQFFFGIPAWVIAAVIVGITALQVIGSRSTYEFVLLAVLVAVALLGVKALGFAPEVGWIPVVPLPGGVTGAGSAGTRSAAPKRRGRARRKLKSVPPPMSKLEEDLTQMEIDSLLDQVSRDGLKSLTKDERKRLERHSKRLRDQGEE